MWNSQWMLLPLLHAVKQNLEDYKILPFFFFFFSYIKMGSVITKIIRETIQELIEITKNLWLKRKLMNGYPESTVSRLINN